MRGTFPGLLDLGIAVTAGAAAGYITSTTCDDGRACRASVSPLRWSRRWPRSASPTSWVPATPWATRCCCSSFENLAAIVFAASVMLLLAGFRPHVRVSKKAMTARLAVTLSAVALVAIPLSLHTRSTVEDTGLRATVANAVTAWDPTARIVELDADAANGEATVSVLLAGPNEPREVWSLAEDIRDDFDGPVELDLQFQRDLRFQVSAR